MKSRKKIVNDQSKKRDFLKLCKIWFCFGHKLGNYDYFWTPVHANLLSKFRMTYICDSE